MTPTLVLRMILLNHQLASTAAVQQNPLLGGHGHASLVTASKALLVSAAEGTTTAAAAAAPAEFAKPACRGSRTRGGGGSAAGVIVNSATASQLAWSEAHVGMMKTMLQPFLVTTDEETDGGCSMLRQLQMSFDYCLAYLQVSLNGPS